MQLGFSIRRTPHIHQRRVQSNTGLSERKTVVGRELSIVPAACGGKHRKLIELRTIEEAYNISLSIFTLRLRFKRMMVGWSGSRKNVLANIVELDDVLYIHIGFY